MDLIGKTFEQLWSLPEDLRYRITFNWHYNRKCDERQWLVHLGTKKTFGLIGATAEHPDLIFALDGAIRQARRNLRRVKPSSKRGCAIRV